MHELLHDIALCIVAAWALGVVAQFFKQPVILAYLVGGFVIGPTVCGWITSTENIETIAELGLIFLLFMIGLEIDLKKILSAGKPILFTAASQILGGCVLGVLFFKLIGFPLGGGKWDALYLGVAAALSSTVIIVKVLYDKRELDTLPGRVTLGLLVLQDLFVILFLAVQPSLNNLQLTQLLLSFANVGILVAAALAVSRFVLPHLFRSIARLPELVLVGAIAWCFLVGEFAARLGLSREMGALIAGVSISTFPYALDVTAKVTSLRDFFVTLFFVGLGMKIPVPSVALILGALVFAGFTVASRLVTTFTPLYLLKQGLRASFLPALNLCQVSEFSLVVLALGVKSHHITESSQGAVSFAFVLLAALSVLAIMNSNKLSRAVIPGFRKCGLRDLNDATSSTESTPAEPGHGHGKSILVLGFFRTASSMLEEIVRGKKQSLLKELAVVDFNPVVFQSLRARGITVIYGDISQRETLMHAGIVHAKIILCTIPNALLKGTTNERFVRQLRELNPTAKIIVTADVLSEAPALYEAGANYLSLPRLDEAIDLCDALEAATGGLLEEKRAKVDALLANRSEVLP
jgi:Kef-type K+ transport system membrane component KefB